MFWIPIAAVVGLLALSLGMLITDRVQVQLGSDLVADTTAETKSAVEDMEGYDEITFLVKLGDVDAAAVITMTVKENTANSTTSPTPTQVTLDSELLAPAGAVITSGSLVLTESSGNLDDKIIAITVKRAKLTKQYVFLSITVATESYEIDSIITLKSAARKVPVTQPSDVYALAVGAA